MRLALVGAGRWGSTVAKRAQILPRVDVVGVVEPVRKHRCELSDLLTTMRGYSSHVDFKSGEGFSAVDGASHVVIATPPGSGRFEQVQRVLEYPSVESIRIEKPVALSAAEAWQIVGYCEARGVRAVVGHTPLNDEAVPMLQAMVVAGESWEFRSSRLSNKRPGHKVDIVSDLAVHDLALAYRLFGELVVVESSVSDAHCRIVLESVRGHANVLVECEIGDRSAVRETVLESNVGQRLVYDELGGTVAINGLISWHRRKDPLGVELEAWRDGRGVSLSFGASIVEIAEAAAHREVVA